MTSKAQRSNNFLLKLNFYGNNCSARNNVRNMTIKETTRSYWRSRCTTLCTVDLKQSVNCSARRGGSVQISDNSCQTLSSDGQSVAQHPTEQASFVVTTLFKLCAGSATRMQIELSNRLPKSHLLCHVLYCILSWSLYFQ